MAARRYEQRIRAETAEQTRRRILDAVRERLRAVPAEPVSLDAVARTAGVARSTVYLVFGSRAGLFDAVAEDVLDRAAFDRLVEAVQHPDAREHLRGALRASCHMFAADRDVVRALYSMAALDADAAAGAVQRQEERRAGGMRYLADRLAEQEVLRPDVTTDEAVDVLWMVASFDAFDALYTGRGLDADAVADRLLAMAERSLCRPAAGSAASRATRRGARRS